MADENALALDELERLAKAATPGEWKHSFNHGGSGYAVRAQVQNGGSWAVAFVPLHHGAMRIGAERDDARFIAAANPKTVLSLIAALRAKETDASLLRRASEVRYLTENYPGAARDLDTYACEIEAARSTAQPAEKE